MTKYSEVPEYVVHEVNIIHRATGAVVANFRTTVEDDTAILIAASSQHKDSLLSLARYATIYYVADDGALTPAYADDANRSREFI